MDLPNLFSWMFDPCTLEAGEKVAKILAIGSAAAPLTISSCEDGCSDHEWRWPSPRSGCWRKNSSF